MTWLSAALPVRLGTALVVVAATACGPAGRDDDVALSASDSLAMASEVTASLAGESAPGAQAYSYRGLYAGISRSRLESFTLHLSPAAPRACQPSGKQGDELSCSYDVRLGPDSAAIHVDALFGADGQAGGRLAREVTAVRELPLDVDGVRLARRLADAFEKQTALLDRRDATYGHHLAQVKMGTLNGVRLNYVDMSVVQRGGREVLTVKMSRSGAAPQPRPAAPATKPASRPAPPAKKKKP